MASKLKSYEFRGSHFRVTRGDYSPILQKVVEQLENAKVVLAAAVGAWALCVCRGDPSPRSWSSPGGLQLTDRTFLLPLCQAYAANTHQEQMLAQYMESFTQGSIEAHKRGSRFWIQDKAPIVER